MKKRWFISFLLFIMLSPSFEAVLAEDHTIVTREDMIRVAKQLYPPGSMGMTVDYCTLPTAATMRQEIVEKLGQGLSDEEVIQAMVNRYGEQALAAPTKKGFNLTLWILPSAAVFLGLIGLLYFLWKKYREGGPQFDANEREQDMGEIISKEDQEHIELALKNYLSYGLEIAEQSMGQLYQDLVDVENDYLMEKICCKDYTSMKLKLYRQILMQQKESTST